MIAPTLAATDRRWRYRASWRWFGPPLVVLQVQDQRTTTHAGSAAPVVVENEWRDARVEDLHEWGGAP